MTLDYDDIDKVKELSNIQTEYLEWFSVICTMIAYVDGREEMIPLAMPESFSNWVADNQQKEGFIEYIGSVVDVYNSAQKKYISIDEDLKNHSRPSFEDFNIFKNSFNGFLASLSRLAGDEGAENANGKHHGLKSPIVIKDDLNKEMERLARNGNSFALSMIRIDGFEEMENSLQSAIKVVCENILKSIRPFDDAYFIEKGYFLLSLKHADMVGADAAISRLQQSLLRDQNNRSEVTISSCVAEPVTGDEVNDLLQTMRKDLEGHKDNKEAVLKFLDVSPLQRYVSSQE